jgi:hypothetical protein
MPARRLNPETPKRLALDLFAGTGSATAAMRDRGWQVVRVDINPAFSPDICADVREFCWNGDRPDLIWASPPCDEFAREYLPWKRRGNPPDLSLVLATLRIIRECKPRFWVIENVRGAVRWLNPLLGPPRRIIFPFFLWGFFPDLGEIDQRDWPRKYKLSGADKVRRAMIPYQLSLALALACERQMTFQEDGQCDSSY